LLYDDSLKKIFFEIIKKTYQPTFLPEHLTTINIRP